MKIADKKFVAVSYDLYVNGEDGKEPELMEKATEDKPLTFIFGMGLMLPAFEKNLLNLQEGDTYDFVLPCDSAYGEYMDEHVAELPKSIFEIDGKFDSENIVEGNMIPMMTAEGQRLDGLVVEIANDYVKMDFNHPLAGEDLHFIGKILEVREATDEEMEQITSPCHCGGDCGGNCGGDCGGDGCHEEGCDCGNCNK